MHGQRYISRRQTITQHPYAVADHGRRQHLTVTDLRDIIWQSFPRHHLGSGVVNKCTMLFKTMSGICGRALEAQRHGTLWTIKQWKRLAHYMVYVRCILRLTVLGISDVDPHETIGGHPACIATTRATRDEGQEEQCCESSGGSVGARQSLTERQPGNPVGRRRRTTATIHRMLSRKEATLSCTTNDARCVGIGGSACP